MTLTKASMALTDLGFLVYWAVTVTALLPAEYAYRDYDNPVLADWNYSFLPLDLLASLTGIAALLTGCRGRRAAVRSLMLLSLALTSAAGLQAVAFWALRGDFTPGWWAPNLFLLLFPLPGIVHLARRDLGWPEARGLKPEVLKPEALKPEA
ncbi:DUF5360 family protein [Kitasatospora sp. NPDC101183]|uniref:DUF5360 family protein n=1 Tax=Kitasatospora sp. NPDC101183 TaxID=3364100 RepID=UPI003816287E